MTTYATKIDLSAETRSKIVALLNQQLADTFDLFSQIKQAHWNVKGMHFIALHELCKKLAEETAASCDDLAERPTSWGVGAVATARAAGKASRLAEYPLDGVHGKAAVEALVERYAALAASTRKAIDTAASLGDAGTSDLFTGISRGLDKSLWFLEAHLQ